jgi:aspartate/methionine/tyrosine aminotransferase
VGNSVHPFSKRTAWQLEPSDFAQQIAVARSAGRDLIDLTVSNPTICGFEYDWGVILGALNAPEAMVYDPDPRGMRSAREAVVLYYENHGALVPADAIVLTTSTSEAYSYLFRLLCDAGDEVLVAQPSYPLFEFLADLDDVRLTPYPLFYDFGWWIDFAELERRISPRTRAVLVVHPNNPTGHWTHRAERQRFEALCERHGLALIVDEVFLDYPIASAKGEFPGESFATGPHPALTFVLSGISKIAALPQMKVAWLAAFGPDAAVREALARLEVIADTFLSLNAPAQLALPHWLANRSGMQVQIIARVEANLGLLRQTGLDVLEVSAGWAAVVRLRHGETSFESAKLLLAEADVIVHPGGFYALSDRRMIVVSLIVREEVFRLGVSRIANFFGEQCA